ncbi:MAG: protein phosphatase CheZ [Thermodesulforhabdaceae bacterium]
MGELIEIFATLEASCSTAGANYKKDDLLNQLDRLSFVSSNKGFKNLAQLAISVKSFVQWLDWDDPSSAEIKQLLQFAFATLRERLGSNGEKPAPEHLAEFYELTGIDPNAGYTAREGEKEENENVKIEAILESSPEYDEIKSEVSSLKVFVERAGGEIFDLSGDGFVSIRFPAKSSIISYLKRVFALSDPDEDILEKSNYVDPKLSWVVGKIKEFMFAFAHGNVIRAREILKELAENQCSNESLYDEIGKLARQLHDALKNLSRSLDPQLREFVEEKLPDSGDRLEHILKLTEHAANTTLDHVELLQNRKNEAETTLARMRTILKVLYPLGDNAKANLQEVMNLLDTLQVQLQADQEDLLKIMTAQDFQDLTGQIIIKIMRLLKDLELSLINLITSFGIPVSGRKKEKDKAPKEFLYGPAHEKKEDALKSQEDVDALLAEFGF